MALLAVSLLLAIFTAGWADVNETSNGKSELAQNPLVITSQGPVKGFSMRSSSGKSFAAFLGIPYGKAERFQAPEPSENWDGILDVTEDAPVCMQYDELVLFDILGVENCLTLNVYTARLPEDNDETGKLLPVMVFINGGVFLDENPSSSVYGPQRLMNYPMVLVMMNYRVGPFGFLSTGDGVAPGNYGHLDQLLAIKWVKKNIVGFGGNPDKVTLAGQSSGGASVIYHMLSPLSKGLFRSAIAQSGNALCPWAEQDNPLNVAQSIAEKLHCPTQTTSALMECLKSADAAAIIAAANHLNMYFLIRNAPLPVVERPAATKSFLTEEPFRLLKDGRINKVPTIVGVTRDEGTFLLNDPRVFDHLSGSKEVFYEKFANFVAYLTDFKIDERSQIDDIFNEYFKNVDFDDFAEVLRAGIELTSDAIFNTCNDLTIRLLTSAGVPVYSYVYDFMSEDRMQSNFTGKPDVDHGSELAYLFQNDKLNHSKLSTEEKEFSDRFLDLWVNFIETSNPTPTGSLKWLPSRPKQYRYLQLSQNMTMKHSYRSDRLKFWRELMLKELLK